MPFVHLPCVVCLGTVKFLFTLPVLLVWGTLGVFGGQAKLGTTHHEGQYQKNLTYKGPATGDQIIYTLYLPPGHKKCERPCPLIVFLHGAGGGNSSSEVMRSYESARKSGKIGNFAVVFPEKYGGTVWRDGAKGKRPETNVLRELLPYLEKKYAISSDRRQRAIMGFSMGAAGSLYWGAKHVDLFSTAVALDAGGGTSITNSEARNYVPEYREKTKVIQKLLKIRLVQGSLNTKRFRESLSVLKIPYTYGELPRDVASYPPGSSCLNRKHPTKKFLHNPACLTEGRWGLETWHFIERNTPRPN